MVLLVGLAQHIPNLQKVYGIISRFGIACTEPSEDLRSCRWFRMKYTEPPEDLRNCRWFRIKCAEPSEDLRNYQ